MVTDVTRPIKRIPEKFCCMTTPRRNGKKGTRLVSLARRRKTGRNVLILPAQPSPIRRRWVRRQRKRGNRDRAPGGQPGTERGAHGACSRPKPPKVSEDIRIPKSRRCQILIASLFHLGQCRTTLGSRGTDRPIEREQDESRPGRSRLRMGRVARVASDGARVGFCPEELICSHRIVPAELRRL